MNKKELIQAFESNRDVCAKEKVPVWDWAIKLAQMLPDDQPQEPCIPVSVIRERLENGRKEWIKYVGDENHPGPGVYGFLLTWLDEEVQLMTPQPKSGDGWVMSAPITYKRFTKTGACAEIVQMLFDGGIEMYSAKFQGGLIGYRPTPEEAQKLIDEFAEANGGWA